MNIGIDDVNCKYAFSCVMCYSLLLRELFAVVHFVRYYVLLDCPCFVSVHVLFVAIMRAF